jgi:long-chain acyl-CoA synthetase
VKVTTAATNVADLLGRAAERTPDKPALLETSTPAVGDHAGPQTVTWRELDDRVTSLTRGLARLGLVGGQRAALCLTNSTAFVASYLAILRAGMVAVPLNPASTADEVARMLDDSGSRACFTDTRTIETVRAAVGQVAGPFQVITVGVSPVDDETAYDDLGLEGGQVLPPRDTESLAVLLYTSGTSGRPRGAMLSHRALLANIEQAAQTRPAPIKPDDLVLGVLPMSHVYGLNAVLGQVLLHGASLLIGPRFDPGDTLRLIGAHNVTVVPVAPPVIGAWLKLDEVDLRAGLRSVRLLLSGAAPLSEETVRAFEERTGIDVEQGYGLTEASPIVTSTIGTPKHKPGSIGRAVPGVELKVVDDAGRPVHDDDPGEICVRGANTFSGYWPDGDAAPGVDGWLATGDIGFLDGDGDLFLVDRLKELVIVSGFNVYPSEIEDVMSEVDGVAECAVIGVPDERTGEAVVAYVVPLEGHDPQGLAESVREHAAARLARFKAPSRVEVVAELPHSATGKVAKGRLRAGQARKAMGLA